MGDENKLYIGSLAYATNDASLEKHFKGIGDMKKAYVVYDNDRPDRSRGRCMSCTTTTNPTLREVCRGSFSYLSGVGWGEGVGSLGLGVWLKNPCI